jgi:hypothetical protein
MPILGKGDCAQSALFEAIAFHRKFDSAASGHHGAQPSSEPHRPNRRAVLKASEGKRPACGVSQHRHHVYLCRDGTCYWDIGNCPPKNPQRGFRWRSRRGRQSLLLRYQGRCRQIPVDSAALRLALQKWASGKSGASYIQQHHESPSRLRARNMQRALRLEQ